MKKQFLFFALLGRASLAFCSAGPSNIIHPIRETTDIAIQASTNNVIQSDRENCALTDYNNNPEEQIDRYYKENEQSLTEENAKEIEEIEKYIQTLRKKCDPSKLSPLMQAAKKGDSTKITELILTENPDQFKQGPGGKTALMYAIKYNKVDAVNALLNLCDDKAKLLSLTTNAGETPSAFAKSRENFLMHAIIKRIKNQLRFGSLCRTYFSPNILGVVMNCITNEQKSIHCAMYHFTLGEPAQAFVERRRAGIAIDLIVDKDYVYNPLRKSFESTKKANICIALRYMINNGIEIRECNYGSNDETNNGHFNMHNKFLVFGDNINHKPLLITGSYNFTHQATVRNWENIVMLNDQETITKFLEQHATMKSKSIVLTLDRCKSDKDTDTWAIQNNGLRLLS